MRLLNIAESTAARLYRALSKYGWQSAPVGAARVFEAASRQRSALRVARLRLLSRAAIGSGTFIEQGCFFSSGAWLSIGDCVYIGRNCSLTIGDAPGFPPRPTTIGDGTWISDGLVLASMRGIQIRRNVLLGEYVSLRDYTHTHARTDVPIRNQGNVFGTIVIEDNVWIGRGCLVQGNADGVTIGQGAIIGANSVVIRSVPPLEVWGGVPARRIAHRRDRGNATAALDLPGDVEVTER